MVHALIHSSQLVLRAMMAMTRQLMTSAQQVCALAGPGAKELSVLLLHLHATLKAHVMR
jgi:hypothetical protein